MMYVYGDKTLTVALDQWQRRKIKEKACDAKEVSKYSEMILDFMRSEEVLNNKMTVETPTV